jgi:hypothetical protein
MGSPVVGSTSVKASVLPLLAAPFDLQSLKVTGPRSRRRQRPSVTAPHPAFDRRGANRRPVEHCVIACIASRAIAT